MDLLSKDIIKEWNISSLNPTEQNDAVVRIGQILYQAILVRSLDILSEKEEGKLDQLLDVDDTTTNDVLLYLKSKIPTFDLLVKEERERLKEDLIVNH